MARAIWSGSISFGMVSIPVKLFGATESRDISFHQYVVLTEEDFERSSSAHCGRTRGPSCWRRSTC